MHSLRTSVALLVALVASVIVAGSASASGGTTYSATRTIAAPPASSFAGSGGGDGWDVALLNGNVYQVFHHTGLTLACHHQSNAQPCFAPVGVAGYLTPLKPTIDVDRERGRLYVFVVRQLDNSGGVACLDTTTPTAPFCGFTRLTNAGDAQSNYLVSAAVHEGSRFYAFVYAPSTPSTGGRNSVLCFDVATAAACPNQPFALTTAAITSVDNAAGQPALVAGRIIVPATLATGRKLLCLDTQTDAPCGGGWPVAVSQTYPVPIPRLSADGTETGVCTAGTVQCFTLDGAPADIPAWFAATMPEPGNFISSGPALELGARVYFPESGQNEVACYDYAASAACAGFPKTFANMQLPYTVNADPERPGCLWVNADTGTAQIQNFDAYTGGACGSGPSRVLAAQFTGTCKPAAYDSLQIVSPAPGSYTGGTVSFADAAGNAVGGDPVALDANGVADLHGVDPSAVSQFLVALSGTSPQALTATVAWSGPYDPSCVGSGISVQAQPTTVTASLSQSDVVAGTAVTASATLAGDDAAAAGGAVTYTWYGDALCTAAVATSTADVTTAGALPGSAAVTLPVGTYRLVAAYGGDPGNEPSSSACGAAVLVVHDPDSTPPATTAAAPSGWQNTSVTVTLTATDDRSGVASTSYSVDGAAAQTGSSVTVADEGRHVVSYWSVDNAGNVEPAHTLHVDVDLTAPVVAFTPSGGVYGLGDTVSVTCTATDALSGVASSTCADVDMPAWQLGAGTHELTATATDAAGNAASAHATVTVDVTTGGVCALVQRWVTKTGVAKSLCATLEVAAAARAHRRDAVADLTLAAFRLELRALSGKALTAEHAATLAALSRAL